MKKKLQYSVDIEDLYEKLENENLKKEREKILFEAFCKTNNIDYSKYEIDKSETFDFISEYKYFENYEITSILDSKFHKVKNLIYSSLKTEVKEKFVDFINKNSQQIYDILNNFKGNYNPSIMQGFFTQLSEKLQKLNKKYLTIIEEKMKKPVSILLWIDPIIDFDYYENKNNLNITIKNYLKFKKNEYIGGGIFPWRNIQHMKDDMKNISYHLIEAIKKSHWILSNVYVYFGYKKNMKSFKIWNLNLTFNHSSNNCKAFEKIRKDMIVVDEPKKEIEREINKKIKQMV